MWAGLPAGRGTAGSRGQEILRKGTLLPAARGKSIRTGARSSLLEMEQGKGTGGCGGQPGQKRKASEGRDARRSDGMSAVPGSAGILFSFRHGNTPFLTGSHGFHCLSGREYHSSLRFCFAYGYGLSPRHGPAVSLSGIRGISSLPASTARQFRPG